MPLRIPLLALAEEGGDHHQQQQQVAPLLLLARHVQHELTRVVPYELTGLDGLRLLSESQPQRHQALPLEILVHPRGSVLKPETSRSCTAGHCQNAQEQQAQQQHVSEEGGGGQHEKLLRLVKAKPIRNMTGVFMVEVSFLSGLTGSGGLEMKARWDRRAADKGRVDELIGRVVELLGDG